VSDDPSAEDLVKRARDGDSDAWDALVERYAPLVWSICRRNRLDGAGAEHVGQSVWLQFTDQLGQDRDKAALARWLATATQRECGKVQRAAGRPQRVRPVQDAGCNPGPPAGMTEHELVLAERHAVLREAFSRLPPDCQRLMAVLIEDPSVPYDQISAMLGIPVSSIGPRRGRCLDKLRHATAVAAPYGK
jgi:RNA polymerase sigma factor (sigma-70 family)